MGGEIYIIGLQVTKRLRYEVVQEFEDIYIYIYRNEIEREDGG